MIVACSPVDLHLPASGPRAPGVHLSGIIRAISMEIGILTPEWEEDLDVAEGDSQAWWASLPDKAKARICMGLSWEQFYIGTQLPEVADHPGEMELNDVFMNDDGTELTRIIIDHRPRWRPKVHEVKCTYKSMNTVMSKPWRDWDGRVYDSDFHGPIGPLANQFMWDSQVRGYCKGRGTTLAALHVLFAAGDYTYPISPVAYRFDIEYTQDEIDSRWEQMTDYRDYNVRLHA